MKRAGQRTLPMGKVRRGIGVSVVMFGVPGSLAWAADAQTVVVPEIAVEAPAPATGVEMVTDQPGTTYVLHDDVLRKKNPGGVNPYKSLSDLPSVNAAQIDPYGFANVPGGNKGLRIRGETSTHGSSALIEGMPLAGPGPGPTSLWLFDAENWDTVSLSEGAVTPTTLAPYGNPGIINTKLRWPQDRMGAELSQSFGSFDFHRSFARADSGVVGNSTANVAAFASASYTDAEKWRGPGSAVDDRQNFEGGVASNLGERLKVKAYVAYNDYSADNYRPLTYSQAQNLGAFNTYDYATASSSVAANAVSYYKYNRQTYKDVGFLSDISYQINDTTQISVKPHYMQEKGSYYDGMANGRVRNWLIDHDWFGVNSEVKTKLGQTELTAGHWYSTMEPPGPPTAWKMYNPTASGGLTGASWSILAKVTEEHQFNTFYAQAGHKFGDLRVQGGARYMIERLPGLDQYNTAGIGDVSYKTALSQSSGVVANRSVQAFSVDEFLPYLGATYDLTPTIQLKANTGRNFGAPALDVWPVYQQNAAAFLARGITANSVWQEIKPETSESVDVGARFSFDGGSLEPTLFYSRSHNKAVSYDPGTGANVAYGRNVAETEAYGLELAGRYALTRDVRLTASASYNRNSFTEALPVYAAATAAQRAVANGVVGKQLPDTPLWMASLGLDWQIGEVTVSPALRYLGDRWGDTAHSQKIPDYVVSDVYLSWKHPFGSTVLDANVSVTNIFDKKYIGMINTSYLQETSGTSAYYYPGAPRTLMGRVGVKF